MTTFSPEEPPGDGLTSDDNEDVPAKHAAAETTSPPQLAELSQATAHAQEAEALLEKAKQEQLKVEGLQKQHGGQYNVLEAAAVTHERHTSRRPTKVDVASKNLTERAEYLTALHEGEEQQGHETENETLPDDEDDAESVEMARTPASDRVFKAANVLRGAAAFRRKGKRATEVAAAATDDEEEGKGNHSATTHHGAFHAFPSKARQAMHEAYEATQDEWHSFDDFFKPKRRRFCDELVFVLMAIIVPSMIVALILFYAVDNPPTGRCKEDPSDPDYCGLSDDGPVASASYWILFLGVRQPLTWLLGKGSDVFFIDWMLLQHPTLVRLLGPRISLIMVQSKGWPAVMFWWAMWDFMLLYGKDEFSDHWLYWQDAIKVFNSQNPSGGIPNERWYEGILLCMVLVSCTVSLKRHFLGLHLGQRLYLRFNDRLQETMKEITLISELSIWVRRKTDQGASYAVWLSDYASIEDPQPSPTNAHKLAGKIVEDETSAALHDTMHGKETIDYEEFLESWEEPQKKHGEEVSGNKIIEFRQAFAVMTKTYFFSSAFGPVASREDCIESADRLFRRLLKLFGEKESIDVNQMTRWMYKGCHHPEQKNHAAHLMLILNPDSEGRLHILDFVKGVDAVYKKVRLLENAVNNASHIDKSYETVINIFFYFLLGCVCLSILGLDPLAFLLSLSSLIVAFSFMIGPGSAQYFEGVMMVLGREPYDVGDKIAIAYVDDPPDPDGSTHWMVESIDLVTTTARLMGTGEVGSFSNGSLARCRLINMNRSPNPIVYIHVKFGTDIPYSTIMVFRSAVQKFVDDRPQEWQGMLGFRTNRVEAQLNFVEYSIVLQHRLTWQSLIPIKESKAAVASFCVEIQKQLGCRYSAPSMPVDINMTKSEDRARSSSLVGADGKALNKQDSMDALMETAKQFSKDDS